MTKAKLPAYYHDSKDGVVYIYGELNKKEMQAVELLAKLGNRLEPATRPRTEKQKAVARANRINRDEFRATVKKEDLPMFDKIDKLGNKKGGGFMVAKAWYNQGAKVDGKEPWYMKGQKKVNNKITNKGVQTFIPVNA